MADWRTAVLRNLNAPITGQNLRFLSNWQRWEGGHTNNNASYNWLNTTLGNQFRAINSVGVRAFPDFKTGVDYTVQTLNNGRYNHLVKALQTGNPYRKSVARDLSVWVSGSPDSASGAKYAARVLGNAKLATMGKKAKKGTRKTQAYGMPSPGLPDKKQAQAAAAMDFVNMAMSYAQTGEVDSNLIATAMEAVDKLGTVEPPTVKTDQGEAIPTAKKKNPNTQGVINTVLSAAHSQIGKPYVFGSGPSTDSFDCSDLVQWAYKQAGIDIPRVTWDQIKTGKTVSWDNLQPGDLVFSNKGGHVVMYVGNGKVIAAPRSGTVVQYQPLSRFKNSFVTAKRII